MRIAQRRHRRELDAFLFAALDIPSEAVLIERGKVELQLHQTYVISLTVARRSHRTVSQPSSLLRGTFLNTGPGQGSSHLNSGDR
jgi:hypothetical protein